MHVVTIDVPHLGNHSHLVHDGRVGVVIDPPRDVAAVETAAEEAAGRHRGRRRDPHPQRLRLRRAAALPQARRGVPRRRRRGRRVRADRRARQRDARLRRHRPARHRDPGPHAAAPLLPGHRRERGRGAARRPVQRRQPAARDRRAHRPRGPRADLSPHPRPVAQRPPARRPASRGPRSTPPTASAASAPRARHLHPTGTPHRRRPARHQPGPDDVPRTLRHPAARAAWARSRATTPTWRRATGPAPGTPPRTRCSTDDEVRESLARGAQVIDVRSSEEYAAGHLPGTLVGPGRRPQCAVYAGWVTPLGSRAGAARRQRARPRAGRRASWGPSASRASGPPSSRTWRPGEWTGLRRTDWAGFLPSPRGRAASWSTYVAPTSGAPGTSPRRGTSRCTSCPTASRRSRSARSGCTAPPATGPPSRPVSSTARAATSCWSTTTSSGSPSWGSP